MSPEFLYGFELLDHIPVGVCVLARDYTVVFWNACLEDWTQIERNDIVGNAIHCYFPHFLEPKYRSRLESIFAGGPPAVFSSQLHRHVFPSPLRGGNYRVQHTTVTAVPAGEGKFHALMAVADVTELTNRLHEYREMRDRIAHEMRERDRVMAEVKVLSGMLPICAACKKIRDDNGYWRQIEAYIRTHSSAEFSHSICPECARRLYPEYCDDDVAQSPQSN